MTPHRPALPAFRAPAIGLLAVAMIASATAAAARRCEPRSLNDWRVRCAADRDEIEDALDSPRLSRSFAKMRSVGEACRVLAGSGGPCAEARAELLAAMLNVGSGRLASGCCVRTGNDIRTVADVIRDADRSLFGGVDAQQCERIVVGLRRINDGTLLLDCAGEAAESQEAAPVPESEHPSAADPTDAASEGIVIQPISPEAQAAAATVAPGTCCDPRTAEAWARACSGPPTGKWTHLIETYDMEAQRDFATTVCAALKSTDIEERADAKRQLIALKLTVRAGYLSLGCRLTTGETVEEAGRRAFALRRDGHSLEARDVALGINSGRLLAAQQPCSAPASGADLVWVPPKAVPAAEPADERPSPEAAPAPKRRRGRG